jgi:predicted nucleotidyltransferase
VDVLVEFEDGHVPGLIGLAGMELDLTRLVGRKVDLNTPRFFSGPLLDRVLSESEVLYAAS